ncbi:MAG: hypothetical protein IKU60_04785 [Clostridia bacterium]|nr:hypothetical protein [Clostridia bacterium]
MFFVEDNNITITKGDSGRVKLKFQNRDGSEYTPESGEEIVFSVKRKKESFSEVVLDKRGCEVVIDSGESEKLPSGEYWYDVCIKKGESERCTAIEGKFIVRKAVHNFE